jgi:transcriptional regulator with XRE-family HTH domain
LRPPVLGLPIREVVLELSKRAGLHDKYVGQLEPGERGASLRAAVKLAGVLGVPIAGIFGGPSGVAFETVLRSGTVGERDPGYRADPSIVRIVGRLSGRSATDLALAERVLEALFTESAPRRRVRRK